MCNSNEQVAPINEQMNITSLHEVTQQLHNYVCVITYMW